MKSKIAYLCLVYSVILLNSCGKSPLESDSQPGRRDYVWTVDTIKITFNVLDRLWASSSSDIWAVGHGGSLDQSIWHYDGTKWKPSSISGAIIPLTVYGFYPNDIWFGGSEGFIKHYDGNALLPSLTFKPTQNWIYSGFHDLYGASSSDLYAVGWLDSNSVRYGKIFHFDGTKWKMLNINSKGDDFLQIRKGDNDPNYYLWSWRSDNIHSDSVKIFSFYGGELYEIYKGLMNNTHGAAVENINGKIYFGIDSAVYVCENNIFRQKFIVSKTQFTQSLTGRNEKDIFLYMWDGLAHYNGNDIEYLLRVNNLSLRHVFVLENEVIVLYNDLSKYITYIYKGVLK
jgi:hypothetical protein